MTDTERIDRYIGLVEKLAQLEHDMKLLQGQIQTVMEEMTEAEGRQVAEKLRHVHKAMVEALERQMERRHSHRVGGPSCRIAVIMHPTIVGYRGSPLIISATRAREGSMLTCLGSGFESQEHSMTMTGTKLTSTGHAVADTTWLDHHFQSTRAEYDDSLRGLS